MKGGRVRTGLPLPWEETARPRVGDGLCPADCKQVGHRH
jgi:hypothetical protein